MKLITFYLPQFHEIKENNDWWGKGFTEWTNVKKSRPLFKGHNQPRIPLDNNYYDLSDIEVMKWQVDLARNYGIYGFCFYHYWFNGKLLLEKPIKNFLMDASIDFPFCMSWANEPWTRSWDGKSKTILMDQSYGLEDDWEKHFQYLLPFFQDKRYIKIDNKPIFLIYKSKDINERDRMIDFFNKRAENHGFSGIYFIDTDRGVNNNYSRGSFSAVVEFEPTRTLYKRNISSLWFRRAYRYGVKIFNYLFKKEFPVNLPRYTKDIYEESLKSIPNSKIMTIPGAFVSWDNSPRRNHESSIMLEASKDEFENYISSKILLGKNKYQSEYLFINAWNEWAEGTYLEPDSVNKYAYLEAIKNALDKN